MFLSTHPILLLYLIGSDAVHDRATKLHAELSAQSVRKITSEYVLMELGDGLSRLKFRSLAQKTIELVNDDKTFQIIPSSTALFKQAYTLFEQHPDKEWGLTDCSSFVIMQQLHLQVALTADQHFEQAGFKALLRM